MQKLNIRTDYPDEVFSAAKDMLSDSFDADEVGSRNKILKAT